MTFPYGFDDTMSLQQMAEALREVRAADGEVTCDWCEEECDGHRKQRRSTGLWVYKCDACAAKDVDQGESDDEYNRRQVHKYGPLGGI